MKCRFYYDLKLFVAEICFDVVTNTDIMEQEPPREADSCSASEGSPSLMKPDGSL
jgi:hypothetical protein